MRPKPFTSLFLFLFAAIQVYAAARQCPLVKIQAERLTDLNIPRSGHVTLMLSGEPTVIGGHTEGFIPTPTAEYYSDGRWHLLQMVYAHDAAITVPLHSGQVLIAGGFEKHLGIGQTFTVEMYDPALHRFRGFGCLERKRASAAGIEMPDGKVYITGNWYHDDGVELYDGRPQLSFVKSVAVSRNKPHLLRLSADDLLILAGNDVHGDTLRPVIAERLLGDTLHIPLFDEWHLFFMDMAHHCDDSFIGDVQQGQYAYLLPVRNDAGQVAIVHVQGTRFSLLPTACPIPVQSQWGPITYYSSVIVDRQVERAYLFGRDTTCRQYVLCLEYAHLAEQAIPLTLYYTDPIPDVGAQPMLLDNGDFMLAGGINWITNNNYSPSPAVYLLPLGGHHEAAAAHGAGSVWLVVAVLVVLLVIAVCLVYRHRHRKPASLVERVSTDSAQLMQRLCAWMEQQRPYLKSDLKLSDAAEALESSPRAISESIRTERDSSFPMFVNAYRIEYARQLLRDHPDKKLSTVYLESGFANETSFFRTFKTFTGMSPKEWMAQEAG